MKKTSAIILAIALIVGSYGIWASTPPPNVVPQGSADNGLRGMQIIHELIGVLVQKMNSDIDATNRLTAALNLANELKAHELESELYIECVKARGRDTLLWVGLDCANRTGLPMVQYREGQR